MLVSMQSIADNQFGHSGLLVMLANGSLSKVADLPDVKVDKSLSPDMSRTEVESETRLGKSVDKEKKERQDLAKTISAFTMLALLISLFFGPSNWRINMFEITFMQFVSLIIFLTLINWLTYAIIYLLVSHWYWFLLFFFTLIVVFIIAVRSK